MIPSNDNPQQLTLADLSRIDQVCLEFEGQLQAGQWPRIEDYLCDSDGRDGLRSGLLSELLALELDYRRRHAMSVSRGEYEQRFPSDTLIVQAAFDLPNDSARSPDQVPDADSVPSGTQLRVTSRYTIDQFHARGGLGAVYTATDEVLARRVAVKFPRRQAADPVEHWRLEREATITGRLEHPGVVPVYAVQSCDANRPYYVMKFVQGETLRHAVDQLFSKLGRQPLDFYESLPFRKLVQRLIDVCDTVAYAHDHQIVHRDIKPSNIMLGPFGETLLLDWGLAASFGGDSHSDQRDPIVTGTPLGGCSPTQPERTVVGTPEFASPEQVRGCWSGPPELSDVYSLGATLYYMLTARRPIEMDRLDGILNGDLHRNISSPRQHQPMIPRALVGICQKAMAFEATDRYVSVRFLSDDLERFLADQPVSVAPDSWWVRLRRWSRKHPGRAAAALASLVVGCGALVVGSWLLAIKNRQLHDVNHSLGQKNVQLVDAREDILAAQRHTSRALKTLTDGAILRLLGKQESLTEADRSFLRRVLADFMEFSRLNVSAPESIEVQAEGFHLVGEIQSILGDQEAAIQSWQEAIRLGSTIESPRYELIHTISLAHARCGERLALRGDHELGLNYVNYAVDNLQRLAANHNLEPRFRYGLAASHLERGNVHRICGATDMAADDFQPALACSTERTFWPSPSGSRLTSHNWANTMEKLLSVVQAHRWPAGNDPRIDRTAFADASVFRVQCGWWRHPRGNCIGLVLPPLALAEWPMPIETRTPPLQVSFP